MSVEDRFLWSFGDVQALPPHNIVLTVYRGIQDFKGYDTLQRGDNLDEAGYLVGFKDHSDALKEMGELQGQSVMLRIGITEGTPIIEEGGLVLLPRHQLMKVDYVGETAQTPREITLHTYRNGE